MWGADMTATVTVGDGAACVFVAVDHCTTECIGLHAAKRGTRFEALEPIREGGRERFGGIGDGAARGLRLRREHEPNYLADDFQQKIAFFVIESASSFVREPEGNGVAERFICTLKENLLWVRSFETIEELRLALLAFKRTYNKHWMLEKYAYRSPAQVRRDLVEDHGAPGGRDSPPGDSRCDLLGGDSPSQPRPARGSAERGAWPEATGSDTAVTHVISGIHSPRPFLAPYGIRWVV